MDWESFHDGNIANLIARRRIEPHHETNHSLQMHSSLVRRLSFERELQGHQGCVNTIAWNSEGSLLISGSDDTRINIWSYSSRKLLQSVETGHSTNIFCTKFIPETSDELVASGAGDAEVRLFNLSRLRGNGIEQNVIDPLAVFQCHSRRVKKLAVEVGNPNVVWSASEDGTLRQHDFREGASCPPAGSSSHHECRNILLDLRRGAKKSLSDPPRQILQLKSCDLSITKPHLLLVGGSDSFARLYDRRMLPPLSSSQKSSPAPPCVSYMCPMHLSDQGRSRPHLTHVTFSPNSEEVLLSYSGEHVYLMDVNPADGGCMRYTSGDVSKLTSFTPMFNEAELQSSAQHLYSNSSSLKGCVASMLDRCRELIQFAGKSLIGETSYYYGIEACNEVLDGCGHKIGRSLMLECLCIRAALLVKRKWKNDAHLAIRDCYCARKIDPFCVRALLCMSEALLQLGQHKEALDFAISAQSLAPCDSEVIEKVEKIKGVVAAAEKTNKTVNGGSNAESRSARLLSLSDILYHSEDNSDTSQDGPRSGQEDSDYDDELELNFETSIAEGGHEVESNPLHGNLNLLIHRRPDYLTEIGQVNGSNESPTSSSENDKFQLEAAIDMKQRYVGHCNVGTDIKQASFLGQKGDFVASGSDDGRWFIWEKRTGRLVKMLSGDGTVVNCIQCHPFDSVVATSGIDDTIKIWTPTAPVPSVVAGSSAGPEIADVVEVMESNQRQLRQRQSAVLPLEILERFRMHEFAEGSLHPFECTQS